jgi:hypothetical protein
MKLIAIALLGASVAFPTAACAVDSSSCEGKRAYHGKVVQRIVHQWFDERQDPEELLHLIQSEQGLAACVARGGAAPRLHTTRLAPGFEVWELAGTVLANELEWAGLLPPPYEGLAGQYFNVREHPAPLYGDAAE